VHQSRQKLAVQSIPISSRASWLALSMIHTFLKSCRKITYQETVNTTWRQS